MASNRLLLPSHFLIKRLSSFVLFFPLLYYIVHDYSLASVMSLEHPVHFGAALLFFWAPLFFYSVFFLIHQYSFHGNVGSYFWGGNVRDLLERFSGFVSLFFLISFFLGVGDGTDTYWKVTLKIVGSTALIFFMTQKVWHFLIQWGVTASCLSQRISFCVLIILFLVSVTLNTAGLLDTASRSLVLPPGVILVLEFLRK